MIQKVRKSGNITENCIEDSSTEGDPNDSEVKKKIRGT
jgi:hypothetical protein